MTIDDNCSEGRTGKMTFVHKESDKIEMTGIESSDGLYEATKNVCTTNVIVGIDKKWRPWLERLGHSGTETMPEALPHIKRISDEDV